jgi:hypothetical protein
VLLSLGGQVAHDLVGSSNALVTRPGQADRADDRTLHGHTLTIRPGFPVRVIVTRDLVLAPYGQGGTP